MFVVQRGQIKLESESHSKMITNDQNQPQNKRQDERQDQRQSHPNTQIQQQMYSKEVELKADPSSKVHHTLQLMQKQLQAQIQNGNLTINQEPLSLSDSIVISQTHNNSRIKQTQKPPTRFYLSTNPTHMRQKYSQFLLLKQQYSHPKNQATIKQMQSLIHSWIQRQKHSQNHRQHLQNQLHQQQLLEIQQEQDQRRKSLETKLQQYKQNLSDKIQIRKLKKTQQHQLMQADSISKQMLKHKPPLYKQKQKDFHSKITYEQQAQTLQLLYKKQSLIPYQAKNLRDHRLKVAHQLKQRSESSSSPRRLKTQSLLNLNNSTSQFVTTINDRPLIQFQQQQKRLRIKQYVQRLKSMSPDKTTLQRIIKVKQQILSNQKILHQNKLKRIQKTSNLAQKRSSSVKGLVKMTQTPTKSSRIQLGNLYLKEQLKNKKIKTQAKNNDTIQENPEESSSIDQIPLNENKPIKAKTQSIEQTTQTPQLPKKSSSFQKLPSKSFKSIPNNSKPTAISECRREYKNYIPQVKQKVKAESQVQKVRKGIRYPQELFREFGKQSLELQKKLMKKINEFKRIQSSQKYEKNLMKETEIDELYHKNLQMKLACLSID